MLAMIMVGGGRSCGQGQQGWEAGHLESRVDEVVASRGEGLEGSV